MKHVRFSKKTNKTPKTKLLKFLKLLQLLRIKENIRAMSKWVSVQGSMALENIDLYTKTVCRQPLYGVGGLLKIKKFNIFAIRNEHNDYNTERSKS